MTANLPEPLVIEVAFPRSNAEALCSRYKARRWIARDCCVQTVGWSVGWCVLRLLTLERYPEEPLGGVDGAPSGLAFWVEVTGLAVLAVGIWGLAGTLP